MIHQFFALFLFLFALLVNPMDVLALQVHPTPEGLYTHQIAHAFFILSMATLTFWLQKRGLIRQKGWRFIQLACICFILWNIGAMAGHMIDSRLPADAFHGSGWGRVLVVERAIFPYLYYVIKMDHLICVPAILLLFFGLRSLKLESEEKMR